MNAATIAVLVVLALLVGAALPVLAQARTTLKAWQRAVEEAGPRVAAAVAAVDELGQAALELRRTVKVAAAVGAAVGPAVAAAVRTMREPKGETSSKENHHEAA